MVYLMEYQLLPCERASELLEDIFGEPAPGAGTLYSAVKRCFEGLEETEEAIKEGLLGGTEEAVVGGFDETGLRVEGKGMWVHARGEYRRAPPLRRARKAGHGGDQGDRNTA